MTLENSDDESAAVAAYWKVKMRAAPQSQLPALMVKLSAHIAEREAAIAVASTTDPYAFVVEDAGYDPVNGRYERDGDYEGSPKFVHSDGQIWMLRYRLPNGSRYWYIADKDQLSRDDGDYYRVKTELDLPLVDGDWRLAKEWRRAGATAHGGACGAHCRRCERRARGAACPL